MKKYFIYIIIVVVLGCKTTTVEREVSLDDLIVDEINRGLENSELFKVYQLLNFYEETRIDTTFLNDSKASLNDLFPRKLKSLYDNREWNEFFITYKNLSLLDYDLSEYNIDQIYFDYIKENTTQKLYKAGVFLGEDRIDYKKLSDNELEQLISIYSTVTVSDDYPRLKDEIISRGLACDNDSESNYIDGVMTIYVNKGISFQNGVGSQNITVGSGFFIDKKGHAITNYHVIESMVDPEYEGVSDLYVKLNGSIDKVPARVIGWDPILDLALIKVSTVPKYIYSFSSSEDLPIGEKVVAIGSPGGLGSTVTSGIVSAIDRSFLEIGSVIQIDSPINPGNSGGPLIDINKRVTNIVFAGIEDFEGVNFAIPVKYLKKSLPALYSGRRDHVWLGAGLSYRKKKFEVIYVKPNSPGYYVGFENGDIIQKINGNEFNSILEIQNYFMDFSPNEIVSIEYIRDGKTFNKNLCLEARPEVAIKDLLNKDSSDHLYVPLFGMDIRFTGKILWDREYVIEDIYPGTIADELSLSPGDLIKVKNWEYNEEYEVVVVQFVIQSQKEGFWEKSIQIAASINANLFI